MLGWPSTGVPFGSLSIYTVIVWVAEPACVKERAIIMPFACSHQSAQSAFILAYYVVSGHIVKGNK